MLEDYSKYQQGIIKRFYANRDKIHLQKLSELVTELYLSEGKQAEKLWKQLGVLLEKMEVPEGRRKHLLEKKDVTLVAALVKELHSR